MTIPLLRDRSRPFGFTLSGGKDTQIGRVIVATVSLDGSAKGAVQVGDVVLEINGVRYTSHNVFFSVPRALSVHVPRPLLTPPA
jgi:hypothetical protein